MVHLNKYTWDDVKELQKILPSSDPLMRELDICWEALNDRFEIGDVDEVAYVNGIFKIENTDVYDYLRIFCTDLGVDCSVAYDLYALLFVVTFDDIALYLNEVWPIPFIIKWRLKIGK